MMLRIKRMADPWVDAIRSLAAKQNLAKRQRKKVGSRCIFVFKSSNKIIYFKYKRRMCGRNTVFHGRSMNVLHSF